MTSPRVRFIELDEARTLRDRNGALFLDVRTPEEYAEAHIPGTTSAPLFRILRRAQDVPRHRTIITY